MSHLALVHSTPSKTAELSPESGQRRPDNATRRVDAEVELGALPTTRLTGAVSSTGETSNAVPPMVASLETQAPHLYPHLYDKNAASGQAIVFMEEALIDARRALEAFDRADFETVGSQLAVMAATVANAQGYADFNRSLRAVLGFIRRASLVAEPSEVDRPALNALVSAFNRLIHSPTLDLPAAGQLTNTLEKFGWVGEHSAVDALVKALAGEDEGSEASQRELFRPVKSETLD